MYTQYFGLREPPFGISNNPTGQYLTTQNKVVYEQLNAGLVEEKKIIILTGATGSGRKTMVRGATSELNKTTALIELQASDLKLSELIDYICNRLPIKLDTTGSVSRQITDLKKIIQSRRIKHTLVMIEHVGEIHSDLVNGMLLLSSNESASASLMQFVVVVTPDWYKRVEYHLLKSFDRNDLCFCFMKPLAPVEVASYVAHYIDQAGCKNKTLFAPDALDRIAEYSKGIPRLINLLGNGGLLAAFLEEAEIVDAAMVDEASTHCLYLGGGINRPVIHQQEIELPAKNDKPAEKVSIVQGWPFGNQKMGSEDDCLSPLGPILGESNDQLAVGLIGEGSQTISGERPGIDSDPLFHLRPERRIEIQTYDNRPASVSTPSVSNSFGSTLIGLGILVLGLFVTFDSDMLRDALISSGGRDTDSHFGGAAIATATEPEHENQNSEMQPRSGLVSAEANKRSVRHTADNPKDPVPIQPDVAKVQKHTPEVDIDAWLKSAEIQIAKKQLMTPRNDNALSSFRSILKVDPAHQKALSGILKIKETYMRWARDKTKQGDFKKARSLYQKALAVMPNDPEVLAALEDLKAKKADAEKRPAKKLNTVYSKYLTNNEQIILLLGRASRLMNIKQLVTPAGNNALSTYRKVLHLAPGNSEALDGIAWIKSTYVNWALLAIENHAWDRAEVFYNRALQVDSTDRRVISMIRELKHRRYQN